MFERAGVSTTGFLALVLILLWENICCKVGSGAEVGADIRLTVTWSLDLINESADWLEEEAGITSRISFEVSSAFFFCSVSVAVANFFWSHSRGH